MTRRKEKVMLSRKKDGKLFLDTLEFDIYLDNMFDKCENNKEIDWLSEQLIGSVEKITNERQED